MDQLINKKKIYFYLFSFLFLATISNNFLLNYITQKFSIDKIEIVTNSKIIEKKVVEELNYLKNKNIFFLNEDTILTKLKKLNFLENIAVKKNYPSVIVVKTKKTDFLAITYINQKEYYVGENGNFIISDFIKYNQKLPIIFGNFKSEDFLKLKYALKRQNLEQDKIIKYYFHKNKRWDLYYDNNVVIKLPNKNLVNAIKLYSKFKSFNKITPNTIIDLRIKDRVIIKNE